MAQGPAANVGFCNLPHFHGGLHARNHADALQCVLQGQAVHHGGQHTHIIGRGAVHSLSRAGGAAPNVAAAHHQRRLHAKLTNCFDLQGYLVNCCWVNAKALFAGQSLAANL